MSLSTCPIDVVNAPVEKVWELLAEPENYDLWWEAKTRSIVPAGRAQAGQRVHAKAGGFNIFLMVDGVDESKHQIDFTTKFPFGNKVVHNSYCWMFVVEHSGEHYGQLVAYYRANNMVPPQSRPR